MWSVERTDSVDVARLENEWMCPSFDDAQHGTAKKFGRGQQTGNDTQEQRREK
jgi:hypothetical protein